jgi:DNA-binding NarL/FixJ family response regulator
MDILALTFDLVAAEMNIPRENFQPLERKLRQERGGDRHYIASVDAMEVQERHAAIWAAFRKGQTPREIAECLGLSQRRVQQIIARTPMP